MSGGQFRCSSPGCKVFKDYPGKCETCKASQRRATDSRRGTAAERGYDAAHRRFRTAVLTRDPWCVCPGYMCPHPVFGCRQRSVVADHYPLSRRELVAGGLDPNDPGRGRGMCVGCHNKSTAHHQPGGFRL